MCINFRYTKCIQLFLYICTEESEREMYVYKISVFDYLIIATFHLKNYDNETIYHLIL